MKEINDGTGMHRRSFLINCAKYVAGATLIGQNLKSLANVTDSYTDYAYCLFKCPQPCTWEASCVGCRDDNTGSRLTCTVRVCVLKKELPSCAHCAELAACNKNLWINYPSMKVFALNKQKEWGLITDVEFKKPSQEEFNVYPTITSKGFTISNTNQTNVEYVIFDLRGAKVDTGVFNTKEQYIDITNFATGSYILNLIKNNELLYISKIIKN